jgi:hypothetical protein
MARHAIGKAVSSCGCTCNDPHIPYDPPAPFREKYRDRPYDGEIAYTDQQLGRLFDAAAGNPGRRIR